MGVPDTGSIVSAWQVLHTASSGTLATPPGLLLPSLLDEPQPFNKAAKDIALNSNILNFLILIASLLL
jgi:hypothetical protein